MGPFEPIQFWIKTLQFFGGWPLFVTERGQVFRQSYGFASLVLAAFALFIASLGLLKDSDLFHFLQEGNETMSIANFHLHDLDTEALSLVGEIPNAISYLVCLFFTFHIADSLTIFAKQCQELNDFYSSKGVCTFQWQNGTNVNKSPQPFLRFSS